MMQAVIKAYLQPHEWGAFDCCTVPADLFLQRFGVDVMQGLRGRYSTARGALKLVRACGGFAEMAATQAAVSGLRSGCAQAHEIGFAAPQDLPLGLAQHVPGGALAFSPEPGRWWVKTLQGAVVLHCVSMSWSR